MMQLTTEQWRQILIQIWWIMNNCLINKKFPYIFQLNLNHHQNRIQMHVLRHFYSFLDQTRHSFYDQGFASCLTVLSHFFFLFLIDTKPLICLVVVVVMSSFEYNQNYDIDLTIFHGNFIIHTYTHTSSHRRRRLRHNERWHHSITFMPSNSSSKLL